MDVVRADDEAAWPSSQHGLSAVWLRGPAQDDAVDSALVRFEPGAATPLHVHHGGQVLYGVSGRGFVEVDGARTEFGVGDIVVTPPGEAHIHGADGDAEFVHLSVTAGRNEMLVDTAFGYPETASDDEYEALTQALRDVQNAMTAARAPADEITRATEYLRASTEILRPFEVRERDQVIGHRGSPGRAQAMAPQFFPISSDHGQVEGRVTFGRFYLGGNGAAHGGAIPLLFDEVLGRLANTGGRAKSRTAFMNVDYRSITPIGVELTVRARFDREEGRKRFLSGEIVNGDVVCAEAHGLFVALRPGQP